MNPDQKFDDENLARAEKILLDHQIARKYFQGELYDGSGSRLLSITLKRHNGDLLELDESTVGRLFMIPDGAVVQALQVGDNGDAPAGLELRTRIHLLAEDEQNGVIAFHDETGPAIWADALYIQRLMLANDAPERLGTVAFGLMAITAYRLGFSHINLFAAGHGPINRADPNRFVGYNVWPKFGFDAAVTPVELNRFPGRELNGISTVQDIITSAPLWWERHGTGRRMRFDLATGSRSWSILLN
jgi:hypothetical protein